MLRLLFSVRPHCKGKSRVQKFIFIKYMAFDIVRITSRWWCTCSARRLNFHGLAEPSKSVLVHSLAQSSNSCSLGFNYQWGQMWIWRLTGPSRTTIVVTEISQLVGAHFVSRIWGNWAERVTEIWRSTFCLPTS